MNLTTHAFRTAFAPRELEWTFDPTRADTSKLAAWAVWQSACGEYQITYDGTQETYTLQVLTRPMPNHKLWQQVGAPHADLELAQAAANKHWRSHA